MIDVLTTARGNAVMDLGRPGQRRYGIAGCGALDPIALSAGNALLGNDANDAGIEVQMFPLRLRFTCPTAVAVTGADCGAVLAGRTLPPYWAAAVAEGDILELKVPQNGMRSYVAVAGGIDVAPVLGSRSTQIREGFGGHEGRELQTGDVLPVTPLHWRSRDAAGLGALPPPALPGRDGTTPLRVLRGAEYPLFEDAAQALLWDADWDVTLQSNRMGFRLSGPKLMRADRREMRSHPIVPGVIQVPPSGQPMIQLADGNAAGGYPKIGHVIEADLWRVAQCAPGDRLSFTEVSLAEAHAAQAALADWHARLVRIAGYCITERRPL